ncbi:MAG: hypothetical protein SFU53_08015 [Terrimicrobiaceae bacterium]|nr:hypothetical protein [Terrimicrobiaceae bacterium]
MDLLAILRCPETHQTLRPATPEECQQAGVPSGLVREDGTTLYPIENGIPCLVQEAGRNLRIP